MFYKLLLVFIIAIILIYYMFPVKKTSEKKIKIKIKDTEKENKETYPDNIQCGHGKNCYCDKKSMMHRMRDDYFDRFNNEAISNNQYYAISDIEKLHGSVENNFNEETERNIQNAKEDIFINGENTTNQRESKRLDVERYIKNSYHHLNDKKCSY